MKTPLPTNQPVVSTKKVIGLVIIMLVSGIVAIGAMFVGLAACIMFLISISDQDTTYVVPSIICAAVAAIVMAIANRIVNNLDKYFKLQRLPPTSK